MGIAKSFGTAFVGGGSSGSSPSPKNLVATVWDGVEFYSEFDRGVRYYADDLVEDGVDEVFTATPSGGFGTQDFPDGLGIADVTNSSRYVLIINDSKTTENPIDCPKATDILVLISKPITIPVNNTNPLETITAYPFRLL